MKGRKRAQQPPPKWRNPIDDLATFDRIDNLLRSLTHDPVRLKRYEVTAPKEERDLICLYAAKSRPTNARYAVACLLSLSWQYPEDYGPTIPAMTRRQNQIRFIIGAGRSESDD